MSIDLTLDRIGSLLSLFEEYTRPTIHVAGTNGKGSVCALLNSVFLSADPPLSVGRFNSPHLVDVADSIVVDGKPVSKSLFDRIHREVQNKSDQQRIAASSFEVLTVTALLVFERLKVDIVICEVGMGGRLDATNVIPDEAVVASVITSIDLDHQAFLGSTVTAIAGEKAGIIRRKKPVVISQQAHPEVLEVVERVAKTLDAPFIVAPNAKRRDWDERIDGNRLASFSLDPFSPPSPLPVVIKLPDREPCKLLLSLQGEHQLCNLGAVIVLLNILNHPQVTNIPQFICARATDLLAVSKGVQRCSWPGRLSFHRYKAKDGLTAPILADGAHNEAASKLLARYIADLLSSLPQEQVNRPINLTFIFALSHSPPKTPSSVLRPLLTFWNSFRADQPSLRLSVRVAAVRFTPPTGMPWVKPVAPSEIIRVVQESTEAKSDSPKRIECWPSPECQADDARHNLKDALEWASRWSLGDDGNNAAHLVVVAGSLYLVADLYRLLRWSTEGRYERTS